MKFCAYPTLYDSFRKSGGHNPTGVGAYYRAAIDAARQNNDERWLNSLTTEVSWQSLGGPYYLVYPSFVPLLSRLNLRGVTPRDLFPNGCDDVLCLRFVDSSYLMMATDAIYRCEHLSGDIAPDAGETGWLNVVIIRGTPEHEAFTFNVPPTDCIEDAIREFDLAERDIALVKLILTVQLMKSDPEIVQPDVLDKDRARWRDGDAELRKRLEEKARRRGKNGWVIGANYETLPHYRRPHLALRWTGEGKKTPKIVPVKGAIVHRESMTQVPTGYELAPPKQTATT